MKKFFKSVFKYVFKFFDFVFSNNWVWLPGYFCLVVWFVCVHPLLGQSFNSEVWFEFVSAKDMNYQMLYADVSFSLAVAFAVSIWGVYFVQWIIDKIFDWFERRNKKNASGSSFDH